MFPTSNLTFRRGLALALSATVLLVGCGGGGGKGGSKPSVLYVTDWSGTGASQRLTLMKSDGTVVTQTVVNQGSAATEQFRVSAASGSYIFRAELNTGANFGGTTTGVTEFPVTTGTTYHASTASAVANLRIEPSSIVVNQDALTRLSAVTTSSTGLYSFVTPGSVTWSASNEKAEISSDGSLRGKSTGDLTVTATVAAKSATAPAQVAVAGAAHTKWTVLVYMSAANTLYPYTIPNIDQMERVANDDVRFVVQWKESKDVYANAHFNGTRRYLVTPNKSSGLGSQLISDLGTNIDMGKAQTLNDFITWGKANYPADRYAVVVWSHGNGWFNARNVPVRATSFDDQFTTAINVWDFSTAFAGHHIDILSFDACLMQMIEVASEVKPYADYIAASAENTPAAGYPYDRVFSQMATTPDADTLTIAKGFVPGHVNYSKYVNLPVTQSLVDVSKVGALEAKVDTLAGALIAHKGELTTLVPALREAMTKYGSSGDGYMFYDLGDICTRIVAGTTFPAEVRTAAQAVLTQMGQTIPLYGATTADAFSHGISVDFSAHTSGNLGNYGKLQFAKDSRWDDWLNVAP